MTTRTFTLPTLGYRSVTGLFVLIEAVRRLGLQGTQLAKATAGSIRLKLLKLGAVVTVSVRRIKIAIASACPARHVFALAHRRLRSASCQAVFDGGAACDRPPSPQPQQQKGTAPTLKPPLNPGGDLARPPSPQIRLHPSDRRTGRN